MKNFLRLGLAALIVFSAGPTQATGLKSQGSSPPAEILNDLLHRGGNAPATHFEHTQVRGQKPPSGSEPTPIEIEWLGDDIPDSLKKKPDEPLETFELD